MKIFTTRAAVSRYIDQQKKAGLLIGFVPTMGALHEGHLSLLRSAKEQTDLVVSSIFVNPTQFNDPKDLEKYPRPVEEDISKLQKGVCDVLFLPEVTEMYSEQENWHIELDGLDNMLEGILRPGHYQGVTQIVKKLFDTINPDFAFFGQKDYQQFLIISKMVKKLRMKVKLVMCPTVREYDGLAMSSRNIYLSETERKQSLALFQALQQTKKNFNKQPLQLLKSEAICYLNQSQGIDLEYFEICNASTLEPISSKRVRNLIALVAARIGKTRLIDNMILK